MPDRESGVPGFVALTLLALAALLMLPAIAAAQPALETGYGGQYHWGFAAFIHPEDL
jgi:hypothetical protein